MGVETCVETRPTVCHDRKPVAVYKIVNGERVLIEGTPIENYTSNLSTSNVVRSSYREPVVHSDVRRSHVEGTSRVVVADNTHSHVVRTSGRRVVHGDAVRSSRVVEGGVIRSSRVVEGGVRRVEGTTQGVMRRVEGPVTTTGTVRRVEGTTTGAVRRVVSGDAHPEGVVRRVSGDAHPEGVVRRVSGDAHPVEGVVRRVSGDQIEGVVRKVSEPVVERRLSGEAL